MLLFGELKQNLIGAKVNKIFEPTNKDIIFNVYSNAKNYAIHFCLDSKNCRINLTTKDKANPIVAPSFCMLLRKYLTGAKLIEINTFNLERVCEFIFETKNELQDISIKKVIVEIMGSHSNFILANENNGIIDSLKHVNSEEHEIMPARKYTLPINAKNNFLKLESFNEFMKELNYTSEISIDKQISDNFVGISRSFINYILSKLKIRSTNLSNNEIEQLYNYLKEITKNFNVLHLAQFENDFFPEVDSIKTENLYNNFFLDDFYFNKETEEKFLQKRNNLLTYLSQALKKYTKRLENISKKLEECNNMEKYRIYGELVTANLYRLKNENFEKITVQNYYDNNKDITIPLDKKYTISKNASLFFKKYNKLKNTLNIVSKQKKETELELEYIESILFSIDNSKNYEDLIEIENEINESRFI